MAQAHIYDLVTDSPASPIPVLDGKGLEHLNRQTSDGERVHICGAVMPGLMRPRYVALDHPTSAGVLSADDHHPVPTSAHQSRVADDTERLSGPRRLWCPGINLSNS